VTYRGDPAAKLELERLTVLIRTAGQVIVGQLHVRPQARLKDEMDLCGDAYLAVTRARVYAPDARLLYVSDFMLVARASIETIAPIEDLRLADPEAWALPSDRES
jgi:hypothetical protein